MNNKAEYSTRHLKGTRIPKYIPEVEKMLLKNAVPLQSHLLRTFHRLAAELRHIRALTTSVQYALLVLGEMPFSPSSLCIPRPCLTTVSLVFLLDLRRPSPMTTITADEMEHETI